VSDALLVFKPDAAHRLAVRDALLAWVTAEQGWKLHGLGWFQPPTELVESHYDFLQDRPFFPWLVDFMTALPVIVGRVSADPAVLEHMRYELGETMIGQARPGSLRERYGIYGGVNCLHLSDSPESGAREVGLWSSRVDLDRGADSLEARSGVPDHTFHLRSLAAQLSAGVHADLAAQGIKRLLKEETDLAGERFEALCRVVLGAFA
jgi:nucleoside-diphosphate kinase